MNPPRVNRPATVVYVQKSAGKRGGGALLSGWLLLGFGFVVACIPFFGFAAYVLGIFLCIAAFALSIVAMSNGRAMGGIALLLGAVIGAPLTYLVTPWISMAVTGAAIEHAEKSTPGADKAGEKLPEGWVPRDHQPEKK